MLEKMQTQMTGCAAHPHDNGKDQMIISMELDCHVFVGHNDQTDVIKPDIISVKPDCPRLSQADP